MADFEFTKHSPCATPAVDKFEVKSPPCDVRSWEHAAGKRELESLIHTLTGGALKTLHQGKEASPQKPRTTWLHLRETPTTGTSIQKESGSVVARGQGAQGRESDC